MFSLLYVDDEPGLLELGKLFLESTGEFEVTTALSADAGLKQIALQDFDAIVSDFQMPVMDGIELLKRVRKSFGSIPFVLFTGRGREEVVIEAINNGVDFYLQKGGDPKAQFAELAHKVRQAVTRRRAETALSDSEKRLADIINFLPDATFAIDTRRVVIAWNRAMERMTGLSSTDVLGKGDYEYALPFYHERRPLLIDIVLSDDPAIPKKYPFVKKEGRTLYSEITIPHFNEGRGAALWFTASPLFNRMGEMVGAIESIREITERKRAEESILSANREYTNLLDQIQDVYYRSDNEGRLVRASRSWATLFGYDEISECIGKSIADDFYVNPPDRKQLLEAIRQNGKVTGFQVLLRKKDGTPVLVEASSHLYFDPAGKIIGIEGTFRDITERKRAEEELRAANEQLVASEEELQAQYNELATSEERIRQSEQKYRTVFETTGTAMLMIEDDATISLVNAEFSRLSGYTREEIENKKRWTEFVVREDHDRMLAQHRMRRENREDAFQRYEFRFVTRSGEIHDIFLSIDVVPGTRKSVASLLDITEKKKADNELLAANEQLAASGEELREQYDELAESEKRVRLSETRLTYMLGFYEYAQKGEKELLEYAIEGAGIVTGSPLGYLAFLNGDESELSMYAWSKSTMAECSMREKPIVYKTEKTGLWGEAVRQRRPVITNDYAAPDPAKKGYPEGHPRIIRHMNVPVIEDGHIMLVAGVANKSSDYSDNDVSELTLLMQGLWTILKQRRVQEELRMVKISVDQAADEVFWMDFEGNILFVNDAACRINGYSRDEFLKMTIYDLNPDLTRDIWTGAVTDLRAKKTQLFTTRHRHRDGKIIDVEIMSVYVRQDKKEYSFAFVRDITERKRSETVLAESERKYRTLFETADEGIWTIDAGFNSVSANRKMQEIFGYSEEEMLGRPVWAFVPPDDVESMKQALLVRQTGVPGRYERRWVRKDGTTIWCFTSASPLFSPEGTFIGSFGMFTDITERRRAETEIHTAYEKLTAAEEELRQQYGELAAAQAGLQKNQQQLEEITFTVPGVVYQFFALPDGTMGLHYVSNRAEEILGIRSDPGDFFERFTRQVDPRDREAFLDSVKAAVSSISPWDFTGRFIKPGGETIWLQGISRPFVRKDETVFSGFLLDITGRKQAEDELNLLKISADRSSDEVFWLDFSGRILYANDAACRATGYSPGEFASMKIFDLDPDFQPGVWEASVADLRERKNQFITTRHQCKDGSIMDVEIVAVYVSQDDKEYSFAYVRDVTERKRAEAELRKNDNFTRALLDAIPTPVFYKDRDGRYIGCNRAFTDIMGVSSDQLAGKTVFELWPSELSETYHRKDIELMEHPQHQIYEFSVRDREGTVRPVIYAKDVFFDGAGQVAGIVGAFLDISGLKQAELAVRESEAKFRELTELLPQIVFETDTDMTLTFVNRQAYSALGYTPDEVKAGINALSCIDPSQHDLIRENIRKLIRKEPFEHPEYTFIRKDGSTFPALIFADPVMRGGTLAGFRGIIIDISDRKRDEEALRESEEKYRTLVESSFDGIAIHQDGILVYVNRTAAHILGADDPELFIGKSAIDIVAPAFREQIAQRIREAPESMQELIREQFLRLDGTPIDVDVMTKPSMWKGRPAAYVTFRDVTAQLRADEALRESSRKYAELFELGSEAIFLIDNETGALLETNSAACEMYGYPRDILLTMKNTDLSAEQEDTRKITTETPQGILRVPLRYHRRRDGTVFPVEIIGRFFAWNGRPVHIAAIRDITEHKRAEAALRESEDKYRMLVEQSRDGVFIIQDGRLVFYNGALAGLTGYIAEDLDSRLLSDLIAPEDRELVLSRARDRAEGRSVPDLYEISLLHKDGIGRTRVRVRAGLGTFRGRPASIGTFYDITEDRRREEALRESEEKYRTLVEVNRDIIYSLSIEGIILYTSPQTITLLGYRPDEMEGRNFSDFVHPDDVEKLVRHIQEHSGAGKPVRSDQFRVRRKEGTYRWFEDKTIYATDSRGKNIVAGTIRDITEEKAGQDALRESEEKFRALVETTGDFIWETDAAGKYTYVSPQVRDILGYEPGDLVGRTPFDIMPRDEAEKISAGFNHYVTSRLPITGFENKAIRKDGSIVILETSGVVRTTNDGSFLGYRGIDRDITVRKQAENALRDSEERTRTILNTAQAGIVLVDAVTHQIVDANKKALELIGLDRGSVVGTICHRFICPAEMGKCPVTDLGQQVDTSERVLITAAGEKIPVLKTVVPVTISGRNILIESFVDISEQKRSEAAIRETNRKLNLLNSITRHDIRNQLMVAQGFAQLAALSKPDATVLDFLAKITAAIEMIQRQIEFTKAYQELGVHAPSWFLLGEVISSVRPGMIALRNTCNPVEIYADPMIDKVFFNLFDNAMKYGERVTEVTVGCKETDDYLIITFADNGCGIPPAEKKKIFEKGYGKNTGLGLFLVREILAITGITIHETGTYGKGAVFEIIIPKGTYRITSSR